MTNGLQSIEVWLIALVVTTAILAGFGIFARWCSFGPAVPRRKLDRLQVGMPMGEARKILGRPREQLRDGTGVTHWIYGARAKRHVLVVEFNSNDVVTSFVHGIPDAVRERGSAREA